MPLGGGSVQTGYRKAERKRELVNNHWELDNLNFTIISPTRLMCKRCEIETLQTNSNGSNGCNVHRDYATGRGNQH